MKKKASILIWILIIEIVFSIVLSLFLNNEEWFNFLERVFFLHSIIFSFLGIFCYKFITWTVFFLDSQQYNFIFSYLFILVFSFQLFINALFLFFLQRFMRNKNIYIYILIIVTLKWLFFLSEYIL